MSETKANNTLTAQLKSPLIWIVAVWIMAIIFGIALKLGWMPAIDIPILSWIKDNQIESLQQVMYIITMAAYWPAYVIILAILAVILLLKKEWQSWFILASCAAVTWGLNGVMKIIFQRERPYEFFQMEQGGLSYPSGHAMVSAAFYLLAAILLAKAFPKLKILAVLIGIFGFLPGLSRLFMGVHYPTDVFVGWLLGISEAWFWYKVWLFFRKEKTELKTKAS